VKSLTSKVLAILFVICSFRYYRSIVTYLSYIADLAANSVVIVISKIDSNPFTITCLVITMVALAVNIWIAVKTKRLLNE
jgi:hypothetical protein